MAIRKKPTIEIQKFIEGIVLKYGLENDFIDRDPELKQKLGAANDPEERIFIKVFYSKELRDHLQAKRPLKELLASALIKDLIEKFINKEIGIEEVEITLTKNLNLDAKTAKEIGQSIVENQQVIKEFEEEFVPGEDETMEGKSPIQRGGNPKGLNQELL